MSVVRLVTQILPHSYDHAPAPPPMQGTAIFKENSGAGPELQAETTVFRCPEGDNGSWEGLTELKKSRLRLSACEEPSPPLVRVRPAQGGVLISVPLRIARSDLQPKRSGFAKKFRCGVCGKGYKTRKPFETHCREHETPQRPKSLPKSYQCVQCGLGFHNAALYSAHCEQHRNQPELQQTLHHNSQHIIRELS